MAGYHIVKKRVTRRENFFSFHVVANPPFVCLAGGEFWFVKTRLIISVVFVEFFSGGFQDAVVADLDKEIAGLEGLMRDLNEITAGDYQI